MTYYCTKHDPEPGQHDQIVICGCGKLSPVELSPAGIQVLLVEMIPRALTNAVTDQDRDCWQLYGHLLMSALRDKFAQEVYF